MKLVIDDVASLETVPCKLRAVSGYRAAQMPYDFEIPGEANGKKGDYLVIHPGGVLDVLPEQSFHKLYQRERPKTPKPTNKATSPTKEATPR